MKIGLEQEARRGLPDLRPRQNFTQSLENPEIIFGSPFWTLYKENINCREHPEKKMILIEIFKKILRKFFGNFGFGIENFDINFDHTMLFFAKCGHIITEEDLIEETRSHKLREILENCFSSNIENSVSEILDLKY